MRRRGSNPSAGLTYIPYPLPDLRYLHDCSNMVFTGIALDPLPLHARDKSLVVLVVPGSFN